MNTKHTPGPWVVNPKYRSPVVCYDLRDGYAPLPIVDVVHGYNTKQARANARLIAATPEMLDTLLAIEMALRLPGVTAAEVLDEHSPIRDAIRTCIAKATGEAA